MCTVVLQVASTLMGAFAQKQQADAQAAAYTAQANAAEQNAKIANRQQESVADAYASKQQELRQRAAQARGQQAATFGARGLELGTGSAMDILAGTEEAYSADTRNLLTNQRNDVWGKKVDEVNYLNNASAARSAADNASAAGNIGMLSTLVSGAATTSAYMDKYKPATNKAQLNPVWGAGRRP